MNKKKNTASLLEASIMDNSTALDKLDTIKSSRLSVPDKVEDGQEDQNGPTTGKVDREKKVKGPVRRGAKKKADLLGEGSLVGLASLLNDDRYRDKKSQFIFRLSEEVTKDLENLAMAYSYRTGHKIHRNDIIRKVLEDFHKKNAQILLDHLDRM